VAEGGSREIQDILLEMGRGRASCDGFLVWRVGQSGRKARRVVVLSFCGRAVLCCHEVCGRLRSVTLLEKDCCIYRIVQVTVISLWL
jgi:hypothetical protein